MILLSARKSWLWVSTWWRYMKLPDMDQKSWIASPASGSESWGGGRETILILQESQYYSLLELVRGPYQGGCSQFLISSRGFLIRPSAIGNINSPCLGNIITSLASFFCSRFPMRPSSPTPQGLRSVRHPSKFPPAYRGVSEDQSR